MSIPWKSLLLQFSGLAAREGAGSLRASVVTHLTRGLTVDAIDPLGMTGLDDMLRSERRLARKMETLESLAKGELKVRFTDYKIPEDIQWSLSRLRTDLDCFHQLEAYALFVSGYLMAVAAFKRASALRTPVDAGKMHRWRMAAVFGWLDDNGPRYAYASHVLAASRARFFKVARVRQKRALLIGAAAAVAVAAAAWSVRPVVARYMPGSGIVLVAVSVLIGVATADALIRSVTFEERRQGDSPDERRDWTFDWRIASERFVQLLAGCALPLAFVWSRIQLAFVDPRYLKLGAVDTANGRVDRNQHFSSTD